MVGCPDGDQVKVWITAKPPTIKAGQPPVSLSIDLRYSKRFLVDDDDDDNTFVACLRKDAAVPLSALVSYAACRNYLIVKVIPSMNIESEDGQEVARQIAPPVVEAAMKGLSRVAGCGISVEAQVEISVEVPNDKFMKLRGVLVNIEDNDNMIVGEDCVVCLEGLSSGAGKILETPCSHFFHNRCILSWLDQHDSCPICRCTI